MVVASQQGEATAVQTSVNVSSVCGDKTRHFKPRHDFTSNQLFFFLCLNLIRPEAQRCFLVCQKHRLVL